MEEIVDADIIAPAVIVDLDATLGLVGRIKTIFPKIQTITHLRCALSRQLSMPKTPRDLAVLPLEPGNQWVQTRLNQKNVQPFRFDGSLK
jgi:hypothetical protein